MAYYHTGYDRYEFSIHNIDEDETYKGTFDDINRCNNDYILLIDIQLVGEAIGRELLNEWGSDINNRIIKKKVKEEIINDLENEIIGYAKEYIDNNICDIE